MKSSLKMLAAVMSLLWLTAQAKAELTHWLVTEWGSVYHNFEKVADKKYEAPEQVAGTADHYYVSTHDGSVYRDGVKIENQVHKDENVVDLDAWGDDYYLLTLQAGLYKNGKVIMGPEKIDRPRAMVVNGSDIWIISDAGKLYKNGEQTGEYFLRGYYPEHFATDGSDVWTSISAGTTGGYYIYKNQDQANSETWVVRELAAANGDFYIFSGKSIFKNFERIAKFEADVDDTGHSDNPTDFFFVLPAK